MVHRSSWFRLPYSASFPPQLKPATALRPFQDGSSSYKYCFSAGAFMPSKALHFGLPFAIPTQLYIAIEQHCNTWLCQASSLIPKYYLTISVLRTQQSFTTFATTLPRQGAQFLPWLSPFLGFPRRENSKHQNFMYVCKPASADRKLTVTGLEKGGQNPRRFQ